MSTKNFVEHSNIRTIKELELIIKIAKKTKCDIVASVKVFSPIGQRVMDYSIKKRIF